MSPFMKTDKVNGKRYQLPCGKCPACVSRRTSGWAFRLMQEERNSSSALFITLTYNSNHIPITDNHYLSLSKRDLTLFFKRLRKHNCEQIKYYAVGEYGENTKRPHYHIILFNCVVDTISKSWELGNVHYGNVTNASVAYNLKYIQKLHKNKMAKGDDRQPEFATMSKRLGKEYITKNMIAWHKADLTTRMYCNLPGGKKIAMPRYYKDQIYTDQERKKVASAQLKIVVEEMKQFDTHINFEENFRNRESGKIAAFRKQSYLNTQNNIL